jgi:4-methylaminobutanoate oxidase (formaldehyde-forming)
MPEEARCAALDVTASEAVLVVMGPKSREILQPLTNADLSNEAFPFGTVQTIEFGMALIRAHRVTYVGELGWELYVSSEMAGYVYERLMEGGAVKHCGLHVLDSCRIEKAFRHYGHDIADEDHVLEAGLGFAVKVDKQPSKFGDFAGRTAVLNKKQSGLERRLIQFQLKDAEPMLYHNEAIRRDGEVVGYLTSGNYGHHLGASIGLGYVPCSEPGEKAPSILGSTYEIEVAGARVEAIASLKPLYDPKSERMKA